MRAQRAFLVLCLSTTWLSTAGCTVLLATPHEEATLRSIPERQVVVVESQPRGATVFRDGTVVGTAPAALDLAYHSEERVHRTKYCSLVPLGGLVDLAAGGGAMWASYSELYRSGHRELGLWSMIFSGLYGAIGLVGVLGPPIAGCSGRHPWSVVVPHDHSLRLSKDGWEESYIVRAPLPSGHSPVSVVIRGLEQFDWQRAKERDTIAAYQDYMTTYPSGRWQQNARDGVESVVWRQAMGQDTAPAYRDYLTKYPSGRWREEAQERAESAVWRHVREQATAAAYQDYLKEYPRGRWWQEAGEALAECYRRDEELLWQRAIQKDTSWAWEIYLDRCARLCRKEEAEIYLDRCARLCRKEAHTRLWQAARREDTEMAYRTYLAHCSPFCESKASDRLDQLVFKDRILAWWKNGRGDKMPTTLEAVQAIPIVVPALRDAGASTKDVVDIVADLAGSDRHIGGMVARKSFPDCLRALRQAGASIEDLARIITLNMRSLRGGHSLLTFTETKIAVWARSGKRSIILDVEWWSALVAAGLADRDIDALNAALLASGAGASQDEERRDEPAGR